MQMNDFLSCIRIGISSCFHVHLAGQSWSPDPFGRVATGGHRPPATAAGQAAAALLYRPVIVTTQGLRREIQRSPDEALPSRPNRDNKDHVGVTHSLGGIP